MIADHLAKERLLVLNDFSEEYVIKETFYMKYGKRMIDIIVSIVALLVTLPINLIIGVITFFDVGFPILFSQERVGKNGKVFRIIKFRNMRNTVDGSGELLPARKRVTKWGNFVRKTSLDELLNFICVLKGDMSIIGPRPLVPQYMSRYSRKHLLRYAVKPGLECPPRDFKSKIRTWNDQFDNDVWYVQHLCLKTDIKMVFNLIRFTLDRKNADVRSAVERGDFIGYSEDGRAISLREVPDEYIEKVMDETEGRGTAKEVEVAAS
ncbi:sugar transferase [Lachnospiraceae bacterium]|nr:sugar transferase [Lachnospiraceae bacterium]